MSIAPKPEIRLDGSQPAVQEVEGSTARPISLVKAYGNRKSSARADHSATAEEAIEPNLVTWPRYQMIDSCSIERKALKEPRQSWTLLVQVQVLVEEQAAFARKTAEVDEEGRSCYTAAAEAVGT